MVTKKGIALTAAIIGGFVGASFLVYLIPDSPRSDIITFGDAKDRLEFAMDRNQAEIRELQTVLRVWESGNIDKDAFGTSADVASTQIDMLILELRGKQIPSEWNQSYVLFIQALESYKAYVQQTKEYVNYKSVGQTDLEKERELLDAMATALERAERLEQESKNSIP